MLDMWPLYIVDFKRFNRRNLKAQHLNYSHIQSVQLDTIRSKLQFILC